MILETQRLRLRPYTDSDFEAIHAYASRPEVARYMLWGPNTEDETRQFLADVQAWALEEPRTKHDFAIELKHEGRMIGGCGIYLKGSSGKVGEVGYVLHPGWHGQGMMPEAIRAMIGYGFGELGLHRIYARCHPDNRPSARVMEKCGMEYEGRLRETDYIKGSWWDFLSYSILEQEWHPPTR